MEISPQFARHAFPSDRPMFYEIRIEGILNQKWSSWFEGLSLRIEGNDTLLSGWLSDQSALYGLLTRISDLGLQLISVERMPMEPVPGRETNE